MKALELDKKFDINEEDILEYFDTSNIKILNEETKQAIIDARNGINLEEISIEQLQQEMQQLCNIKD
jgi:hypothetical protein